MPAVAEGFRPLIRAEGQWFRPVPAAPLPSPRRERRRRAVPGSEGAGRALSVVPAPFYRLSASLPPRGAAHVFGSRPGAPEEEAWWADTGRGFSTFPDTLIPTAPGSPPVRAPHPWPKLLR